jgi:predicted nucleic acid-binding protein
VAIVPSSLFVDTSAFVALSFDDDPNHGNALRYYEPLPRSVKIVTTLFVIAETYTWLRYRVQYSSAIHFLQGVDQAAGMGTLSIIYPNAGLHRKTANVLTRFDDQRLSYVDASSFAVIEEHSIRDIFAFDSHFLILRRNVWPMTRHS